MGADCAVILLKLKDMIQTGKNPLWHTMGWKP